MAYFIDQSGVVVEVPDAEVESASILGYSPASPEQVESAKRNAAREAEFSSPVEQLKTGAEGVARGATFGLSDVALTGLGITEPERMAARREVNPTLATTAEIGGALAPMLVSGGAGALGTAARAAPTVRLSEAAAGLGERAAGAVLGEAAAGESAARAIARGAVRGATQEAVEAVPYALGQVVTEQALGDENLTAERLVSSVTLPTLLSAGAGAILGGGGVAIPRAIRRARDAVQKAEEVGVRTAEEVLPETAAALSGVDRETAAKVIRGRAEILTDPAENARIRRETTEMLQEGVDSFGSLKKMVFGKIRPAEMRTLLADVAPEVGEQAVKDAQAALRARAAAARADSMIGEGPARKMEQLADGLEPPRERGGGYGGYGQSPKPQMRSPYDAYRALDGLKQDLDELAAWDVGKPKELRSFFRGARGDVKGLLEDSARWGEAGARQAALNAALTDGFNAFRLLSKKFGTKNTVRGSDVWTIDPVKVNTYLNAAADDRRRLRDEIIDNAFGALRALTDQVEASAKNAPSETFVREGLDALKSRSDEVLAEARRKAELTHLYKQMSQPGITSSGPAILASGAGGPLTKSVFGGAVGGPLGAAAGAGYAIYQIAESVPMGVAALTHFERTMQRTAKVLDRAAASFVRGERVAGPRIRSMTSAIVTQAIDDDEDYRALASDPGRLVDRLDESTRELDDVAPRTAHAVRMVAARQIAYLASLMPPPPEPHPLGVEWKPDAVAITAFRRAQEVLHDGVDAVLRLASEGRLTRDHMRAMEAVMPEALADLRIRLIQQISALDKRPDFETRQMLSLILGQDVDGSWSQVGQNQAAYMPQQKPAAPPPAPRVTRPAGERYRTEVQRSGGD